MADVPTNQKSVNVKVLVVGPVASGKTSFVSRCVKGTAYDVLAHPTTCGAYRPTLGMDMQTKILKGVTVSSSDVKSSLVDAAATDAVTTNTDTYKVKLMFMDLSGNEAYCGSVRSAYGPITDATANATQTRYVVLIVVDASVEEDAGTSLSATVNKCVDEVSTVSKGTIAPANTPFLVVGTHADQLDGKAVGTDSVVKRLGLAAEEKHLAGSFLSTASSSSCDGCCVAADDVVSAIVRRTLLNIVTSVSKAQPAPSSDTQQSSSTGSPNDTPKPSLKLSRSVFPKLAIVAGAVVVSAVWFSRAMAASGPQ